MAKTNPSYTIETTFSAVDISTAASVYQFTAAADEKVQFIVKLTNAAGNGDYIAYLTRQWEGAGAASVALGKTTLAAASGETVIEFTTIQTQVKSGDVIEVMIDGLAGDTSVNGNIRIVADNPSILEQADILSDAVPFLGASIAAILLDTGTTLVAQIATLLLTNSATAAASGVDGSDLTLTNKLTFGETVSSLTIPATWNKAYLTVKDDLDNEDATAILQILVTSGGDAGDGIQYVNKAAATVTEKAYGSLTVDQGAGTVAISVADDMIFTYFNNHTYDIKFKLDDGTTTKPAASAKFTIQQTETKTV